MSRTQTNFLARFFKNEKSSGIVLIVCVILSIWLANSSFQDGYISFWNTSVAGHTLDHWINEGLMAIFFLLIGLELKKELYAGELANVKTAMLPVFAAIGGIVVPAGIYLYLNYGTVTQAGVGIPMATDIVFALAILSLLGKRVPASLKIFLTALAVIDDLGAIITIAIFYSKDFSLLHIGSATGILLLLWVMNRLRVRNMIPYLLGGIALWYCMLSSGIHATISGVLLAFVIPFDRNDQKSASHVLQHFLHMPVSFLILPVFALANTAIVIEGPVAESFGTSSSQGIFFGLLVGKPAGILLFSLLAVSMGICRKPDDIRWKHIAGVGILGGIGFTMSIFITPLAFADRPLTDISKIAIVITSAVSAIVGMLFLYFSLPAKTGKLADQKK
jgi:NhaA family Na+:H+ antiporter